jgi:hypothetical protein
MLGFGWGMVAGNLNPHRPDYRRMLDYWNWLYHVGRRWDGGFSFPASVTGGTYLYHGPIANTGCVGMVFGVPTASLRIFGRGESVFGTVALSPELRKGIERYHALDFAGVRAAVSDKTALGRQLLRAADARERDIAASLKSIKSALAAQNPVKAEVIARTLDAMCRGALPEARTLLAKARSETFAPVRDAAKVYNDHRFLVHSAPASLRKIQAVAKDKSAGIYRTLAAEWLAISPDAFQWTESATVVFNKYWETKETDPLAMGAVKRLAAIKGGNWACWFPNSYLRKNGFIKDTFVDEWVALLPASGLKGGRDARLFAYLPLKTGDALPAAGWTRPEYDDSKWTRAKGPLSNARDSLLKPPRGTELHFFRIKFNADNTNYAAWKLYVHNRGFRPPAVIYLNGHCIAWVDQHRTEYEPVDLPISALKYLKKGENVLAARTRRSDKGFDIGIYAKEAN